MSSDSKPLLSKVARFVANSTSDWMNLNTQTSKVEAPEISKAAMKAMIKRRQHNDLIRKRELEMLRNIRHRNSTPETGTFSLFPPDIDSVLKAKATKPNADLAVKAKIDAIEQQMVGGGAWQKSSNVIGPESTRFDTLKQKLSSYPLSVPQADSLSDTEKNISLLFPAQLSEVSDQLNINKEKTDSKYQKTVISDYSKNQSFKSKSWTHDAELDEPVMAFANANFNLCEQQLTQLIQTGASRHDHIESWMTLFDLYRVLDTPSKFDSLASLFADHFDLSAPQWYALPKRVADHLQSRHELLKKNTSPSPSDLSSSQQNENTLPKMIEGWVAPLHLNEETVSSLQFELLQMPHPWALDWGDVKTINVQAAHQLTVLLKNWSKDQATMTWIGIDNLLKIIEDSAPTGSRGVDPALWLLRLELLRLCNRAVHFDEVAIDYCITYEQSPPSWEPSTCKVQFLENAACTQLIHFSHISDISTSFIESQIFEDTTIIQVATLELSGQLLGNIKDILLELENQLGTSVAVIIDCTYLIRIDFIAAGDLLNWVLSRKIENRKVEFVNPHRLIALFFGAMGIAQHADIQLQTT